MYKKILVALDNSPADQNLLAHIIELAAIHNSELLLVHVAEGWAARHYKQFALKESEEMIQDRQYLERTVNLLKDKGLNIKALLMLGEPSVEILKIAQKENCQLIAMSSHGHRFFADIFLGSTIEEVRHRTSTPLLIVPPPHC